MVDRYRPIVAGYVPVELGVIVVATIEEADTVAHGIIDVEDSRCVDRIGNVNFEVAVVPGLAGIVLQFLSIFVSDGDDIDEERVVRTVRSWIFDRDRAMNAMPLAGECERDLFADQRLAIRGDGDRVLEVGDAPVAGLGSGRRQWQRQKQKQKLNHGEPGEAQRNASRPARRSATALGL